MVERNACTTSSSSSSSNSSNSNSNSSRSNNSSDNNNSINNSNVNKINTVSLNGVSNVLRESRVFEEGVGLEELTSLRRARFSIFKWFKRAGSRASTIEKRRKILDKISRSEEKEEEEEVTAEAKEKKEVEEEEENGGGQQSVSSSAESVDTFYSTTTVRSFAFHSGGLITGKELSLDILKQAAEVGPFAAGASKLVANKENTVVDVACTLPSNVHSRRRDITTRYSLQPTTTSYSSCDNLPLPEKRALSGSLRIRHHHHHHHHHHNQNKKELDSTEINAVRRKVHVKGKRRAPNPPEEKELSTKITEVDVLPLPPQPPPPPLLPSLVVLVAPSKNSNRRKRPAPRPPENHDTLSRSLSLQRIHYTKPTNITDGGMDSKENYQKQEEGQVISNDTLILQGGLLHSKKDLQKQGLKKDNKKDTIISYNNLGVIGVGNIAGGSTATTLENIQRDTTNFRNVGDTGTLCTAMPRPWYKRSVFEHSRDSTTSRKADVLRTTTAIGTIDSKEETTLTGAQSLSSSVTSSSNYTMDTSLSRLSFFHRGEHRQMEERKRDVKRKSGLSILTNISELDKEAAAIVQEEQARARASMLLKTSRFTEAFERTSNVNEELVQDMVASAMENSSPKQRGTRALISKFNAISNITKVTVNNNFFARRDQQGSKFEQDVIRKTRTEQTEFKENSKFIRSCQGNVRVYDKDISKYFLPQQQQQQKTTTTKVESKDLESRVPVSDNKFIPKKDNNDRLIKETSSRISFLQSQLVANRMNEPLSSVKETLLPLMEEKMKSKNEQVGFNERREKERKKDNVVSRGVGGDGNGGGYLLSRSRSSNPESIENVLPKEPRKLSERNIETTQKEFSNIFDEIERQLRIRKESKHAVQLTPISNLEVPKDREILSIEEAEEAKEEIVKGKEKEEDEGISSKVTKVLDILVEAEKDGKAKKPIMRATKSIPKEDEIHRSLIEPTYNKFKPNKKTPNSMLNNIEDRATTDLKEMLKEMKHSLPKRPKPKKPRSTDEVLSMMTKDYLPSTSKISYIAKSVLKKEATPLIRTPHLDYEIDKQKVSSSSQTSGNVRRLNQPSTSSSSSSSSSSGSVSSSSGWKQEDVVYRTSGKSLSGLALAKNTFQLIRPRDFAVIEAIKTTKGQQQQQHQQLHKENTYANVIERSLYANALVPPTTKHQPDEEDPSRAKGVHPSQSDRGLPNISPSNERPFLHYDEELKEEHATSNNMNTLAINRLLRKLEAAIASGHHQQAAGLAKELARLKIHCSVIRQRTARLKDRLIKVNMYIEDKLAHQGPIPLQLPTRMTVAELKIKVYTEFEIPTNVQRWIIGKNLADRDETTLEELQAIDGSPIFLYLVAPELQKDSVVVQTVKSNSLDELSKVEKEIPQPEEKVITLKEEVKQTTVTPYDKQEQVEPEEEQTPEEIKMERYEELISLENCDVIPNSESIECPICFVTYGPREGVILRDCLHMFCKLCIANTIKYCEDAEVKCPYRDTEYTCESTLQEREIKALVETEVYQQHLAKSIAQAENNAGNNAFHCKTPDCPGWCYYDDDVNNFLCPVCGVNNCLTCQAAHIGKNCKQYQQELRLSKETDQESRRTAAMLEEMVDRGEALACPTCAVVLMKKWGCDWLKCSMCKTEICWVTRGPRWGPGGKGDISGGCRCGENGVKCHPRCNYCH